jgi:hypothetical protein
MAMMVSIMQKTDVVLGHRVEIHKVLKVYTMRKK